MADSTRSSVDRASDGESHLAVSLRPWSGEDTERFWCSWIATDTSGSARSSRDGICAKRLVDQGHASSDHAQRDVSAGVGDRSFAVVVPPAVDTGDLYTHFARRRLSAEEIRDSILAVSGDLDPEPAEGHPFPSPITWGFSQHSPFSAVYDHNKRSVYLMTQRLKRHPFLALFDGPDTNASTADRLGTTVPTQALYFLNDPFVHQQGRCLGARLESGNASESQQIEQAYRLALCRSATTEEATDATAFLASLSDRTVQPRTRQREPSRNGRVSENAAGK